MNDQIHQILKTLKEETASPTKVEGQKPKHFFNDIKNAIKKHPSRNDVIDLTYNFYQYEKCLTLMREGRIDVAKKYMKSAQKALLSCNEQLKKPSILLYYPMEAYYHYVNKDYNKAIKLLDKEMCVSKSFFEDNSKSYSKLMMEQLMNKYRIFYTMENYYNTVTHGKALLDFVLFEQKDTQVIDGKMSTKKMEGPELYAWAYYVTNVILSKPLFDKKDNEFAKRIIKNIFFSMDEGMIAKNTAIPGYNKVVSIVKSYYSNQIQKITQFFFELRKDLYQIPFLAQCIILTFFKEKVIALRNDPKEVDIIDKYINEVLKIDPKYIVL